MRSKHFLLILIAILGCAATTLPIAAQDQNITDPVKRQLDDMKKKAADLQKKADKDIARAKEITRKAGTTIAREQKKIIDLKKQKTKAEADRKRATDEAKLAKGNKETARANKLKFEQMASRNSTHNKALASEYEKENQTQIEKLRKEMDAAWKRYEQAQRTYVMLCEGNDKAARDAALKHMLRMQTAHNEARKAYEKINPPGENGEFEKAMRQRTALREKAKAADSQAIKAEAKEKVANKKVTDAGKKVTKIKNDITNSNKNIDKANKDLKTAEKLKKQAHTSSVKSYELSQEHKRKTEQRAASQKAHENNVKAQEEADKNRRKKNVKQNLDIGGRNKLDDVRINDIRRRLWKKLLGSHDPVLNNIARAMGAKQVGETMRTALGFSGIPTMVTTLVKDKVKNWNKADVRTGTFILDHGIIYGKMTIMYNSKTGEYVVVIKMVFPKYKNPTTESGIEVDKPYTIIITGKVTLIK